MPSGGDEAFKRAQARKYAQDDESADEEDAQHLYLGPHASRGHHHYMRRMTLKCAASTAPLKPRNPATSSPKLTHAKGSSGVCVTRATKGVRAVGAATFGDPDTLAQNRKKRRLDIEA